MGSAISKRLAPPHREIFLDWLKGYGILQFIVWHVFENFYIHPPITAPLFRLVFPVTGFFVFTSGFLVGYHYFMAITTDGARFSVFKRLFIRTSKLFLLVFIANMAISFLASSELTFFDLSHKTTREILSLFYVDRWDISLQVLIAIAVTLISGYLFALLFSNVRGSFIFAAFVLACLAWYDLYSVGHLPYLWRYVAHGILGLMIGIVFNKFVLKNTFSGYCKRLSIVCLSIFVFIEILVILKPELYNFFLYNIGPSLVAVGSYFIGLSLVLYVIYDLKKRRLGKIECWIITVGQSTLFVYLLQIVLIDIVVLIFKNFQVDSQLGCLVMSACIFFVCLVACWLVNWGRQFSFINYVYKAVFL